MLLYLIRHGESLANATNCHAGQWDTPLTDKGREEAKRTRARIEGISFDRIYASDLSRARETCLLAIGEADPILDPDLREIHVGELATKSREWCEKEYGEPYLTHKKAFDFRPWGGENSADHRARAARFLARPELTGEGAAAVFCHGGTIRCLLEIAGDPEARTRAIPNTAIFLFDRTENNLIWKGDIPLC